MNYLIENAIVIDKKSEWHQKQAFILIEEGKIKKITNQRPALNTLPQDLQAIQFENLHISTGWFDMRSLFPDPGQEHKETLQSGCQAALAGGFTEVALLPNTSPIRQSKDALQAFKQYNLQNIVKLHPIAAVTQNLEGNNLTEILDLHFAGAVAFSEGIYPLSNADVLRKTLQYLQPIDALLIQRPEERQITRFGTMHEGVISAKLGLKGMPQLAESLMIERDLRLLEYAGGKIHFSLISGEESVNLIREAKAKGLQVTCDIAAHQLAFEENDLITFDSYLKVNPPFRTKKDNVALKNALIDGTIDAVVSDHRPHDQDSKNVAFAEADFGMIALETTFATLNTYLEDVPLENWIEKITDNPRKILGLEKLKIAEGQTANLTLFNPEKEWVVEEKSLLSKSKNTPFLNKTLKGKALAIFHQKQFQAI